MYNGLDSSNNSTIQTDGFYSKISKFHPTTTTGNSNESRFPADNNRHLITSQCQCYSPCYKKINFFFLFKTFLSSPKKPNKMLIINTAKLLFKWNLITRTNANDCSIKFPHLAPSSSTSSIAWAHCIPKHSASFNNIGIISITVLHRYQWK